MSLWTWCSKVCYSEWRIHHQVRRTTEEEMWWERPSMCTTQENVMTLNLCLLLKIPRECLGYNPPHTHTFGSNHRVHINIPRFSANSTDKEKLLDCCLKKTTCWYRLTLLGPLIRKQIEPTRGIILTIEWYREGRHSWRFMWSWIEDDLKQYGWRCVKRWLLFFSFSPYQM